MKIDLIFNTMTFCIFGFVTGMISSFLLGAHTHFQIFSVAIVLGLLSGVGGLSFHRYIFKKYQIYSKLRRYDKFILNTTSVLVTFMSFWMFVQIII